MGSEKDSAGAPTGAEAPAEIPERGVRAAVGAVGKDVARGLAIRRDWGLQYVADAFRNELAWLGITHSQSFVGEPQCNGVIERFMRTLKENASGSIGSPRSTRPVPSLRPSSSAITTSG